MLTHHIEDGPARNPNLIAGLDYALDNSYGDVPATVRAQVRRLYEEATPVRSELWERMVYGYFRNCYAPEDGDRNVSNAIIPRIGAPVPPAERHLAYLMVREYFPDAEPRVDLIASGGDYGTKPCAKCGKTLQYEARVDAYAEAITALRGCPSGGLHEAVVAEVAR
jgi:hypothetical protein